MDGRAYRRVSIDREIKCQIGNAATWVVLYDLSAGGAMIEGGHIKFVVGDEVQLHLHDSITVSGKVIVATLNLLIEAGPLPPETDPASD